MNRLSALLLTGLIFFNGCIVYIGDKGAATGDSNLRITVKDLAPDPTDSGRYSGTWSSRGCWARHESPTLCSESPQSSYCRPVSWDDFFGPTEIPTTPSADLMSFVVTLPAGALSFSGTGGPCYGSGEVIAKMDPHYLRELQSITADDLPADNPLVLLFSPLDIDYARQITEAAGEKLTFRDLRKLSDHRVEPEYFGGMRTADPSLSTDQVIHLKDYRIQPEFIRSFRQAGYDLSADELVKAKSYRLDPEDLGVFRSAGYEFSVDELIKAKSHRVPASFAAELSELDVRFTLDEMIKLRNYRIDPAFIKSFRQAGYDFDVDELVKAKNYRVNADEAAQLRKAGYRFSLDDLIRLKNHNVSADFMLAVAHPDYEPFTVDELARFRQRNLSAEDINRIRAKRKDSSAQAASN